MESVERKIKKKPTKVEEMTKEQIRTAILKKHECNTKAQRIVESLLEKGIDEAHFMQCLPDINQSHFDDVIEERAITHICGYPLCSKSISDIPKQKYRISMKTNKVYDITARKSFCCNSCYQSAMFVKKQMLTSPLWFREYEDIPKFQLQPLDAVGSLGQEVDLAIVEKVRVPKNFASINDFADASFNEMSGHTVEATVKDLVHNSEIRISNDTSAKNKDNKVEKDKKASNEKLLCNMKSTVQYNHEDTETTKITKTESIKIADIKPKKSIPNPTNIVGDIIEKPERKIDPIITDTPTPKKETINKKLPQKRQPSVAIIAIEVEKCLAEWFTLDTLLFLFGEAKVKEMVTDKGECIKEYLNNYAKSIFYTSNTYDQYQALCKKLNMLELEDRRYEEKALQRETKPLPDYTILQEESKKMQLKVKAFLAGETEVPEPVPNTRGSTSTEEEHKTKLPLVDKTAQNAIRRRIVCEHLNKVLPDLLKSLGLSTLSISTDVRLLVNTFKLKPDNIMFKPLQWTLITIVIIKLLSLRDKRLEYLLQAPTAFEHMQLLLLSYQQNGGYLDRLISWLTDIDRLLDTKDTQLTVEQS